MKSHIKAWVRSQSHLILEFRAHLKPSLNLRLYGILAFLDFFIVVMSVTMLNISLGSLPKNICIVQPLAFLCVPVLWVTRNKRLLSPFLVHNNEGNMYCLQLLGAWSLMETQFNKPLSYSVVMRSSLPSKCYVLGGGERCWRMRQVQGVQHESCTESGGGREHAMPETQRSLVCLKCNVLERVRQDVWTRWRTLFESHSKLFLACVLVIYWCVKISLKI